MPELPEVETCRRGIEPHIVNNKVTDVIVRNASLRQPVSHNLVTTLPGNSITHVTRRAKYLLLASACGTVIIHLGMSGSLRILSSDTPAGDHDHVDFVFSNNIALRYRDPRRFGLVLLESGDPLEHKLLKDLGPEPLGDEFNGEYLHNISRRRRVNIKSLLMNSHIVSGIGNIYACEALFSAGINPRRAAGRISLARYNELTLKIKTILEYAITKGGTTFRDFTREDGKPGYFKQELKVYDRGGELCSVCGSPIHQVTQAQRSTYYCTICQT